MKYKSSLILKIPEILKIPLPTFILVILMHSCAPLRPLVPPEANNEEYSESETETASASKTKSIAAISKKAQSKSANKATKSASSKKTTGTSGITGIAAWDRVLTPWLGTPYLMGGSSKTGVDCSGFVGSVYSEKERMYLPRTAAEAFKSGMSVEMSKLKVGDLVFFGEGGHVSHVGLFVGKKSFIHASTSQGVMVSPLDDSYWKPRYMGAKRYL